MILSGVDRVEIIESGGEYGSEPFTACPVTAAACAALLDNRWKQGTVVITDSKKPD